MTNSWKPLQEVPETSLFEIKFIDLLVRANHSGSLFRVPDCFIYASMWWSRFYHYPLKDAGWEPVAWMSPPEILSEEELS